MTKTVLTLILAPLSGAALALAPANVGVVNGTGAAITKVEIRDAAGGSWKSVAGGAANGGRVSWSFDDGVCAYDVRATLDSGQTLEVRGVNPCDAKLLTLKRNGATGWVDYD